jgi:hypothetical protein
MPDLSMVWDKIIGQKDVTIGNSGYIPVKVDADSEWLMFRNTYTIFSDTADPEKVEKLRHNAYDLVNLYPGTLDGLAKLGVRVSRLLNHVIKSQADVIAWQESIFNTGPVGKTEKGFHTQALSRVKAARKPRATKKAPAPKPAPAPASKVVLGRPRKDGLVQGSPEAKAADAAKKKEYQRNRRAAARKTVATVTAIADAPKRRLIRRPKAG